MTEQTPGGHPKSARPHAVVGGRYELGALLGRGGMAEVRKGTDVRLGRTVAVKRLRTDLASDATFQTRFRREAQSSAALNHPAIVSVYDTGEEMSSDGTDVAQPYIVMEYVEGRTLREILREGRKILPERALEITGGILDALDYSHRAGIIHRDIKPANVMLTPAGDVKVMDFGIARAIADASSSITQTAAVVGTAQYLSPEQARGETVDSRSDVYSAGCVLYELLTGRPPFVGDSPVSVAYQHVRETPAPPSSLDHELDAEIDAIVLKALAKRVEDRYQSASAMHADIDRYLAGKPITAPPVLVPAGAPFLPATEPDRTSVFTGLGQEQPEEPPKRKRAVWGYALLVAAIAAIFAAAMIFGPMLVNNPPEQRSVPTLSDMTREQAQRALTGAGLTLGDVTREPHETVERGLVIGQDPAPGEFLDPGSEVDIVLSSGKPTVVVPNVVGRSVDDARDMLEDRNLEAREESRQSDQPAGTVIGSDPEPAESVTIGTEVTLFVSEGPREVPNVVGMEEERATRMLERRGFNVDVIEDTTTPAEPGMVLRQSPEAGTEQPQGSTVVITVSRYEEPEPTEEPSPTEGEPSPTEELSPTDEPSPTEDATESLGTGP